MDNRPIGDRTFRVGDRNENLKILLAERSETVLQMSSSETLIMSKKRRLIITDGRFKCERTIK